MVLEVETCITSLQLYQRKAFLGSPRTYPGTIGKAISLVEADSIDITIICHTVPKPVQ